jgi:hypothetical protein
MCTSDGGEGDKSEDLFQLSCRLTGRYGTMGSLPDIWQDSVVRIARQLTAIACSAGHSHDPLQLGVCPA